MVEINCETIIKYLRNKYPNDFCYLCDEFEDLRECEHCNKIMCVYHVSHHQISYLTQCIECKKETCFFNKNFNQWTKVNQLDWKCYDCK